MEDMKALLIGVAGGLLVIFIQKLYSKYRRNSIRSDIEFLKYEKEHLEAMKRSSVEMNRSSFRAIFAVLLFISAAQSVPYAIQAFRLEETPIIRHFPMIFWFATLGLCYRFWRRYDDLKNIKSAVARIDARLEKLSGKL